MDPLAEPKVALVDLCFALFIGFFFGAVTGFLYAVSA